MNIIILALVPFSTKTLLKRKISILTIDIQGNGVLLVLNPIYDFTAISPCITSTQFDYRQGGIPDILGVAGY